MAGQPRGEVIDLVVGLRDDDARLAAGCQGGGGLDDQGALPGAGRRVDDDASLARARHRGQDSGDDAVGLGGRVEGTGLGHARASSSGSSAGGCWGGPP